MSQESVAPFFVFGTKWSGLPDLKSALLLHKAVYSIDATQFYRWSDAYGTEAYKHHYLTSKELMQKWLTDGFSRAELTEMFEIADTRQNMINLYARRYSMKHSVKGRWFDASTEHAYGLLLLRAHFPDSPLIHIHAHPFEVIASLMHSPSRQPLSLHAAVNHWLELMQLINIYKKLGRNNLIELKYEDFLKSPKKVMSSLLTELNEDSQLYDFATLEASLAKRSATLMSFNQGYTHLLTEQDKEYIQRNCRRFMKIYEYKVPKLESPEVHQVVNEAIQNQTLTN